MCAERSGGARFPRLAAVFAGTTTGHAVTLRGAVSRRDQIRMSGEEVAAFLEEEQIVVCPGRY